MNKTWLIIKREYLTRVRKKTFIISTILFPLLYIVLIFGMGFIADKSRQNLTVAVIDSSGYFSEAIINRSNQDDKNSTLKLATGDAEAIIKDHKAKGYDGYIVIPNIDWRKGSSGLVFKSNKSYGTSAISVVEKKLNRIWDDIKNDSLAIDRDKQVVLATSHLGLTARNLKDEKANARVAETIGYVCGFLIYLILLIYGSQVMMGVMEEKTNRIAEVIVSSVKPFQMMLGKILGIGLVALTQFLLWIAFMMLIYYVTRSTSSGGGMANAMVGSMNTMFTGVNVDRKSVV